MRATHERYPFPPTGPRREPPSVCYACGGDVEETPRFGPDAALCDDCRRTETRDWSPRR